MDKPVDRRREIDRVVAEALERPADQRQAFVDRACEHDSWLRDEVMSMLEAAEEPDGFLEAGGIQSGPVWQAFCAELATQDALAEGARVGPYRVISEIGRGGMAVVHLACRADGRYEQEVALKVIKRGIDTEAVIRRFAREQKIHGSLQHPAIARLIDAGETDDGRPFFVLEFIDGAWIDRYCDEHDLGISDRLRIFLEVADAVQYAHQKLVLHRDLKPSNILVDSSGQVKLVDFGIAKTLSESDASDGTALTRSGLVPMTPEYASPEQLRGDRVTVASDVYQLGLVLYQLLAGRRAYELQGRSSVEIERVVCEQDPIPPSRAALKALRDEQAAGDSAGPVPGARRRARALAGDLDRIVLMALRKEPERRYPSVDSLAADIARHLRAEPVAARKNTLVYRSGKFLRRHVMSLSVAAMVVAALLLFSWQLKLQRDRAQAEAAKARQVTAFVENLFRTARPLASDGTALTVREALDQGADRIRDDLEGQTEIQAAVMNLIGSIYGDLGVYERASSLLEEGLELREGLLGAGHPEVAASLTSLGALRFRQGEYQQAEELLARSVSILEGCEDRDHATHIQALQNLAKVYRGLARYDESESVFRRCLEIQEEAGLSNSRTYAENLTGIGGALMKLGKPAEAEKHFERALLVFEEAGASPFEIAVALSNLGTVKVSQGKVEAGAQLLKRAITLKREVLGPSHPQVAASLMNLGMAFRCSKRSAEAEEPLTESLKIQYEASVEGHPRTAIIQSELAALYIGQGRLDEAEALIDAAIGVFEAKLGGGHPLLADALRHQAELDLRQFRLDRATAALERCREIREQHIADGTDAEVPLAEILVLTGMVHQARGDLESGKVAFAEAVRLLQAESMPAGEEDVWRLAPLAKALLLLGRVDEARPVIALFAATELSDPMLDELVQDDR